jgi:hypothetical protein
MFDCIFDECPENPKKCHLYWEMPWENTETGEQTIRKGCILSQHMGLPIVQVIVRSAHTASEQSSKVNNNLLNGLCNIGNIMIKEIQKNAELGTDNSEVPAKKRQDR